MFTKGKRVRLDPHILLKFRIADMFTVSVIQMFFIHILCILFLFQKDKFLVGCRLLILDNISSLVLPLLRDGHVTNVFGFVSQIVAMLRQIAATCNIAVVVVNNSTSVLKKDMQRYCRTKGIYFTFHQPTQDRVSFFSLKAFFSIKLQIWQLLLYLENLSPFWSQFAQFPKIWLMIFSVSKIDDKK